MYDKTAGDVAKYLNVTPQVVTGWARNGYPVRQGAEVKKIKLEGAMPVGSKLWRFDLKAVINFIECVSDEQWVLKNVNTKLRMGRTGSRQIGLTSSSLTASDTKEQLMALLKSQRAKPRTN